MFRIQDKCSIEELFILSKIFLYKSLSLELSYLNFDLQAASIYKKSNQIRVSKKDNCTCGSFGGPPLVLLEFSPRLKVAPGP